MNSHTSLLVKDQWLSDCVGVNCYNCSLDSSIKEINLPEYSPLFISAKLDVNDSHSYHLLKSMGFREINQQLTYNKELSAMGCAENWNVKTDFKIEIQDAIINPEAFSSLFVFDRFSTDKHLPRSWSAKIKRTWIESAENKKFVTALHGQEIVGFILFKPENEFFIELVCVVEAFQGQGVGISMLKALENYAVSQHVKRLVVGTQGDNKNSTRMYKNLGLFSTVKKESCIYTGA